MIHPRVIFQLQSQKQWGCMDGYKFMHEFIRSTTNLWIYAFLTIYWMLTCYFLFPNLSLPVFVTYPTTFLYLVYPLHSVCLRIWVSQVPNLHHFITMNVPALIDNRVILNFQYVNSVNLLNSARTHFYRKGTCFEGKLFLYNKPKSINWRT